MVDQVLRASNFTKTIGVNAHLNYTDGKYTNIDEVLTDLSYIGVSLVRTASLSEAGDPLGQAHYATAADAGIKFDLVVDGSNPLANTLSLIDQFEAAHPGSIAAIEGPNEIDWRLLFCCWLKPALVVLTLDDQGHAVVAGLCHEQFIRLRGDDGEGVLVFLT